MTRRLVLTYLAIALVGLAVLVIPLGQTFASRERDRLLFDIERDATVVASLAEDALEAGTTPDLDQLLNGYASGDGRIIVVNNDGLSVYDTDTDQTRDFSTRPEIVEALDGQRSDGIRPSETLGLDLMYVAVPVASGGTVHGAARITYPTSTLDARIAATWWRLAGVSAVVLATVAAVGWVLARSVTRSSSQRRRHRPRRRRPDPAGPDRRWGTRATRSRQHVQQDRIGPRTTPGRPTSVRGRCLSPASDAVHCATTAVGEPSAGTQTT